MAGKKKLEGKISLTLESKEFKTQVAAISKTLGAIPTAAKSAAKESGTAFETIRKDMRSIKSTGDVLNKISYSNLTSETKSLGKVTGTTSEKIDGLNAYLVRGTKNIKILTEAEAKNVTGLKKVQQANQGTIKSLEAKGLKIDKTTKGYKALTQASSKTTEKIQAVGKAATKSKDAISRLGQESTEASKDMTKLGSASDKSAKDISQAGAAAGKATGELDDMGSASGKTSAQTIAMGQSITDLSGSITSLTDTAFGFQEKIVAIERSKFGLQQTTEDLKRAEEDYAAAMEEGELSMQDMERMEKDLMLLRQDHAIELEEVRTEQEALNGEFVSFGVTLGSTGLQMVNTVQELRKMEGMQKLAGKASKLFGINLKGAGAAAKTATTSIGTAGTTSAAAGKSMTAGGMGAKGLAGGLRSAGTAAKGFMISIGPIGWAIIGITALWAAWETNLGGFRDIVHSVIDALQWLGGLIANTLKPALKGISAVSRALGFDIGNLDDAFGDLTEGLSDNIDAWQDEERATRDADEALNDATITAGDWGDIMDGNTKSLGKVTEATEDLEDSVESLGDTHQKTMKEIEADSKQTWDATRVHIEGFGKIGVRELMYLKQQGVENFDELQKEFTSKMNKMTQVSNDTWSATRVHIEGFGLVGVKELMYLKSQGVENFDELHKEFTAKMNDMTDVSKNTWNDGRVHIEGFGMIGVKELMYLKQSGVKNFDEIHKEFTQKMNDMTRVADDEMTDITKIGSGMKVKLVGDFEEIGQAAEDAFSRSSQAAEKLQALKDNTTATSAERKLRKENAFNFTGIFGAKTDADITSVASGHAEAQAELDALFSNQLGASNMAEAMEKITQGQTYQKLQAAGIQKEQGKYTLEGGLTGNLGTLKDTGILEQILSEMKEARGDRTNTARRGGNAWKVFNQATKTMESLEALISGQATKVDRKSSLIIQRQITDVLKSKTASQAAAVIEDHSMEDMIREFNQKFQGHCR